MSKIDTTQVKPLIDSAKSISILLPQNPHYDVVASGLALKLTLESAGRTVSITCPDPMTVEFNRLVGVDSVGSAFGTRNLVISFPDQTEHVDKVSYNLDGGELKLVITPKSGSPDLDHRRLKFIPSTSQPDMAILLGVDQLYDLGGILGDAKEALSQAKVISISRVPPRESYAHHHLYDHDSSSVSEITLQFIDSVGLALSQDAASNLLAGHERATEYFQAPHVTVSSYETAADLMKRGAKRAQPISATGFPPGSIPGQTPTAPVSPAQTFQSAPTPAQAQYGYGYGNDQVSPAQTTPAVPADWYEPKIYSGPKLI